MKNSVKKISAFIIAAMMVLAMAAPVFAAADGADSDGSEAQAGIEAVAEGEEIIEEETAESGSTGSKAMAAAICVGIAAGGGAIGMGLATAKTTESVARQPEAEGEIRTAMMLGLVFIETAIIYALIVAILVIFVL